MTNWKEHGNPFLDFTEEITQKWIDKGFSKEQVKEWLDIDLKPSDSDYCRWLRDKIQKTPQSILNHSDSQVLRKQYTKYLENQEESSDKIIRPAGLTQQFKRKLTLSAKEKDETKLIKLEQKYQTELMEVDSLEQTETHGLEVRNQNKVLSAGLTTEIENLSVRTKRQLSLSAETQAENKSVKLDELVEESIEIDNNIQNQNWRNINRNFIPELTNQWQNLGFSYNQCKEWLDIGMKPTDAGFCAWLRDEMKLEPSEVLNNINIENNCQESDLRKQFEGYLKEKNKKSTLQLVFQLRNKGFYWKEIEELVNSGLKSDEVDYVSWLRNSKKNEALKNKDSEQLKKEYLISRWYDKGFTDEEISAWSSVGLGLQDGGYAAWLRDIKKVISSKYLEYLYENNDGRSLRKQHQKFLEERRQQKKNNLLVLRDWKKIHLDFTEELQKEWENKGFSYEETNQWINFAGLQSVEAKFAQWLKDKQIDPERILNSSESSEVLKDLRKEYKKDVYCKQCKKPIRSSDEKIAYKLSSVCSENCHSEVREARKKYEFSVYSRVCELSDFLAFVQKFEDLESQEKFKKIESLGRDNQKLTDELEDPNTTPERKVQIQEILNQQIKALNDELDTHPASELSKKLRKKYQEWRKSPNSAQAYLDLIYPTEKRKYLDLVHPKEVRSQIKELDIAGENLKGSLDLSGFSKLEKLFCVENQLTSLNVSGCSQLESLHCSDNQLTELNCSNCPQLTEVWCTPGNHQLRDLSLDGCRQLSLLVCRKDQLKNKDLDLSKFPRLAGESKNGKGRMFYQSQSWLDENYPKQSHQSQSWLDKNYPKDDVCQRETDDDKEFPSIPWGSNKDYRTDEVEHLESMFTMLMPKWRSNYGKTREKITRLNISEQSLKGSLSLVGFNQLQELYCFGNFFSSLNLDECIDLKELNCQKCTLNSLNFLTALCHPEKLEKLDISSNGFPSSDLSFLTPFVNLKTLYLNNNNFVGSLEFLKNLSKLETLDISDTDLNSGAEYLPENLKMVFCSVKERPKAKIKEIEKELGHKYRKSASEKDYYSFLELAHFVGSGCDDSKIKLGERAKNVSWMVSLLGEEREIFDNLRNKYSYRGTCEECQQPNSWGNLSTLSSSSWCKSCNAKHFQENFHNWTSGNQEIDKLIQKCQSEATSSWSVLEWIPYEQFISVEYLAEGGFSKVYKAEWKEGPISHWDSKERKWKRIRKEFDKERGKKRQEMGKWDRDPHKDHKTTVLKVLNNSQNISGGFLQELINYKKFKNQFDNIANCYGISKDEKGDYIMVMDFMDNNLREYLRKYLDEREKNRHEPIRLLREISQGLKSIHDKDLVHRDLHPGNILKKHSGICRITDLGLSKPADETNEDKVYGVLPYVAPEVLLGKTYTKESDIYSLGMVFYEILTGLPPYFDLNRDNLLGEKIFPKQVKYPQLLVDLIIKCWDDDPAKRPTASTISETVDGWFDEFDRLKKNTEFYQQYQEAEEHNKTLLDEVKCPRYKEHLNYHSQLINTKEIVQLFQESDEQVLEKEIKKIEKETDQLLTEGLKELISKFIQTYKKRLKNRKDKEARSKIKELKEKLKENNFSEENIDKIICYCERFIESEQQIQANIEIPTNK